MKPAKSLSDIIASSHLLMIEAQLLGTGYYLDTDRKQSEIEIKARSLCGAIKQLLPGCKEEYITPLLDCYSFLYTIAYRKFLSPTLIATQLQRFFSAWQSGDKNISESDIYALILFTLRSIQSASEKLSPTASGTEILTADQLLTFLSLRDKWLTTLRTYNYFPEVTTFENYRRLTLLTEEPDIISVAPASAISSLTSETLPTGSVEEKLGWFRHNHIDDLSTLSNGLLVCYRRYILSLPSSVIDFEKRTLLDTAILEELLRRNDLHPDDREAYRLAIDYNHLLLDD